MMSSKGMIKDTQVTFNSNIEKILWDKSVTVEGRTWDRHGICEGEEYDDFEILNMIVYSDIHSIDYLSKTKTDAVYYQGEWQSGKQEWYSKIKFDGDVGGSGYAEKIDTMTFTITVTEGDLQNLGDGNSLFVTLGVWYGAKESSGWTSGQAGHYEFLEMNKEENAPAAAAVSAQEVALPVKQDN